MGTVLERKGEVGRVAREEMAFCQKTYFFSIMVLLLKYSQFHIRRFLHLIRKIKINEGYIFYDRLCIYKGPAIGSQETKEPQLCH